MKKLLALLLLTTPAFAGSATINDSSFFGGALNSALNGLTVPNLAISKLVQIIAQGSSGGGNAYMKFQSQSSPVATTQYSVPSGKSFYFTGIHAFGGSLNAAFLLGYGTAALASNATGTAPTGNVPYATAVDTPMFITGTANTYTFYPITGSFPANAFPYVEVTTAATQIVVMITGIVQ